MTTAVFPTWVRWCALLWLIIWIPVYWHTWGFANFFNLCDISLILTCIGLWQGSALLLSSQALASLLIDFIWIPNVLWQWITGTPFVGGVDYLFNPDISLWGRLFTLFHAFMPFILLAALRRTGYDNRGLLLQCYIAAILLLISRFILNPSLNINFVFADPISHRPWSSETFYFIVLYLVLVSIYTTTQHVLKKMFHPALFISAQKSQPLTAASKEI